MPHKPQIYMIHASLVSYGSENWHPRVKHP